MNVQELCEESKPIKLDHGHYKKLTSYNYTCKVNQLDLIMVIIPYCTPKVNLIQLTIMSVINKSIPVWFAVKLIKVIYPLICCQELLE